jgi:cyclopropane-fatty-acyl-phospholipid synthase
MNAEASARGAELVEGGRSIRIGSQWLARLWSGGIHRILDRVDMGLARGAIEATLPDGTTRLLGGRAPGFQAAVTLRNMRALLRLATGGSVGWYQAWEAGEWDSPDPVALFALFTHNLTTLGNAGRAHGPWRLAARLLHWFHRNTRTGSARNVHAHYDLGNDFYAAWLDPTMCYSSARFAAAGGDLEQAQQCKIESIAARLEGARTLLEIGCGWGALARHFADKGIAVTGISLSDQQLEWARKQSGDARIEFIKQDYRDVSGPFDAIASVEMVEAVGRRYWPEFMDAVVRCLEPGGRAAIQYIAMREEAFDGYARSADFIQTYIFPGGMLIRESEFRRLAAERGLAWQDRESFGQDYAETLSIWRRNFDRAVENGQLPAGFDGRFVRLWRFYLMYCEGGFRGGAIDVAQVTLVKQT